MPKSILSKIRWVAVAMFALSLVGCASNTAIAGIPTAGGSSTPQDSKPPAAQHRGCWVPGSGRPTCGDLVSAQGQPPGSKVVDLHGVVRLSPTDIPVKSGEIGMGVVLGPCLSWTVPVAVTGNTWKPDVSRANTLASGCIESSATPGTPDYEWARRLLNAPFDVAILGDGTLRASGADSFIDFAWE